jgi:hypothetical protein
LAPSHSADMMAPVLNIRVADMELVRMVIFPSLAG